MRTFTAYRETIMEQHKCETLQRYVKDMRVKDVRQMFATMRNHRDMMTPDSLFVQYGITVGEFCTAYVVNMSTQRRSTEQ